MPSEGYSTVARDFVRGCLIKDPRKRPTYDKLLSLPWIASLSMFGTITEEPEDFDDGDDDSTNAAMRRLSLHHGIENPEVAEWVTAVLNRKARGLSGANASKPALHAAPLDSVSPTPSPKIDSEPERG